MAHSSGSAGLEAVVLMTADGPDAVVADADRAAIADFAGPDIPLHLR